MFKDQMQQDVIMVLKFPSNSPVTHVAANTLPHLSIPAAVTVTCSRLFAVNRWHNTVGEHYQLQLSWTEQLKKSEVFKPPFLMFIYNISNMFCLGLRGAPGYSLEQSHHLPIEMDSLIGEFLRSCDHVFSQ